MNVLHSGRHLNSVVVWRWTSTWRLTWIQAPWELIWDNHYLNDLLLIVHDHPLLPNLKRTKCSRYEGIMHTTYTKKKNMYKISFKCISDAIATPSNKNKHYSHMLKQNTTPYSCNLSPFNPSQLLLATLKQDVFMLAGSTFHHLYSYPRTGSVPAGQGWHATDATQSMFNIFWMFVWNYVHAFEIIIIRTSFLRCQDGFSPLTPSE